MTATVDHVLVQQPRVLRALRLSRETAAKHTDSDVLTLAEHRICQLLGTPISGALPPAALSTSPFGQAVLAFVEQWVIDVATISDDMVMVLRDELGDDRLMDFIHGVLVVEQRIRLDLAWQRLGLAP